MPVLVGAVIHQRLQRLLVAAAYFLPEFLYLAGQLVNGC